MQSDKRVSFYTDLSKHYEFITALCEIINRSESSISTCYLTRSSSDRYCLFITSKSKNSSATFDFCNFFSNGSKINDGFKKEDIDDLATFLDDYTFKNQYEGQFFASKFFESKLNSEKKPCVVFKFTADEEHNRYIIDGKNLEKYFSVTTRSNLAYILSKEDNLDYNQTLLKCNLYSLSNYKSLDWCIYDINKTKGNYPPIDKIVVEYYKDVETLAEYIKGVFELVDDKLVSIDIETLM